MSLTIDGVVGRSVDKLYQLFENESEVLHEVLIGVLEGVIFDHFDLPQSDGSMRLFKPVYWFFKDNYATSYTRRRDEKLFWTLKGELPDKEEFKRLVLGKYTSYLEENLRLATQSSS